MEEALTPVQRIPFGGGRGKIWLKRDDLFEYAGIRGGKVRTCLSLATMPAKATGLLPSGPARPNGLVTASSRSSPQAQIVARVAASLKIPARLHMPQGPETEEMRDALAHGAEIIQHKAGYNSVIVRRALDDPHIHKHGYRNIPFGMECREALSLTVEQTNNIPKNVKRVVVPVGSGMTLCGVLIGCVDYKIPIVGIQVGADPEKRLYKWASAAQWWHRVTLVKSEHDYHTEIKGKIGDVELDPIYEAKCLPYLLPGDLFWIVGIRKR